MTSMKDVYQHQGVMVEEAIEQLNIQPNGIYVDATFGRGGHTTAILEKLGKTGKLLVMDRDKEAIEAANLLKAKDPRIEVRHGAFSELYQFCVDNNLVGKINGILFDLGVSSPQLDKAARGFSFRLEGPLDMRMDLSKGMTAAEWLQVASEEDIAKVLKELGEERFSKRIAKAIYLSNQEKPITTTLELAEIVKKAHPAWEKHKHPATRAFQAIRLFINDELNELSKALDQALLVLAPKGRLVVISFHSLEDRRVKQFIEKEAKGDIHPRRLPIPEQALNKTMRKVTGKIKPSALEVQQNPRSRSAVMRVAEKLEQAA